MSRQPIEPQIGGIPATIKDARERSFFRAIKETIRLLQTTVLKRSDLQKIGIDLTALETDAPSYTFDKSLQSSSGVKVITSNYQLQQDDNTLLVDCSAGDITINMLTAKQKTPKLYEIVHIGTANTVTLDAEGSETIAGSGTFVFLLQFEALQIKSDGDNWFVI